MNIQSWKLVTKSWACMEDIRDYQVSSNNEQSRSWMVQFKWRMWLRRYSTSHCYSKQTILSQFKVCMKKRTVWYMAAHGACQMQIMVKWSHNTMIFTPQTNTLNTSYWHFICRVLKYPASAWIPMTIWYWETLDIRLRSYSFIYYQLHNLTDLGMNVASRKY